MKERVVVAMSGGVDSSVAAALLKEQGYEVVGMTMCFSAAGGSAYGGNLPDTSKKRPGCCGLQGIEDAQRVCHKLNIRHYVLNMQKALKELVIQDFIQEYLRGRTPNPCVRCNQYLKFDILLKKALSLDAQFLATGHYARIKKAYSLKLKAYSYLLKKAQDLNKDQSYFLYRLTQAQMRHILFPIGDYTKDRVRLLAKRFNLAIADKLASQEICFLPDTNYRQFLQTQITKKIKPGLVLDQKSNILGQHQGIAYYTIGQREGLGIAGAHPLYICHIDPKSNQITVGTKEDACAREFLVNKLHFISGPIKKKVALRVKIRYNHKEAQAQVLPSGTKIKVIFGNPQFAITPGQSAVFYNRDKILGGGIIERVF